MLGGGAPIAQSTVTLLAASSGAPKQLAQTKSDGNGNFAIHGSGAPDSSLYLVAMGGVAAANKAAGDNPAIALIAVLGSKPPARVVINEMTTVASVWTNAQFLDDTTLEGQPLSLRIAAGNVPTSLTCKQVDGVMPFRVRSTVARRLLWPISPHLPTCFPAA